MPSGKLAQKESQCSLERGGDLTEPQRVVNMRCHNSPEAGTTHTAQGEACTKRHRKGKLQLWSSAPVQVVLQLAFAVANTCKKLRYLKLWLTLEEAHDVSEAVSCLLILCCARKSGMFRLGVYASMTNIRLFEETVTYISHAPDRGASEFALRSFATVHGVANTRSTGGLMQPEL